MYKCYMASSCFAKSPAQISKTAHEGGRIDEKTPQTRLTYPRDIFVLGVFDHGNESRPINVEWGAPSSADVSPAACCVGRSEQDQGWWPEGTLRSAIGHHLPCKPASPDHLLWLNPASVSRTGPHLTMTKFFLHVVKKSHKNHPSRAKSESLPPDSTQWPDGLIMYSRWVWIWNIPAGLTPPCWASAHTQSRSRSLWPAPEGELIEALGWTYWFSGGEVGASSYWQVTETSRNKNTEQQRKT